MNKTQFEWDSAKEGQNQRKHGVGFVLAQYAFADTKRVILFDEEHSTDEERFYCLGRVNDAILTVRFTYRNNVIRIFGAGYWRRGKKLYEKQNHIHE